MTKEEVIRAAKSAQFSIEHPQYGIDGEAQVSILLDHDRELYAKIARRAAAYGLPIASLPTADQADQATSPGAACSQYIAIIETIHRAEDKIDLGSATSEQVIESTANSARVLLDAHEAAFELLRFWRGGQPPTQTEQGLPTFPGTTEPVLEIVKRIEAQLKLLNDRLAAHRLV